MTQLDPSIRRLPVYLVLDTSGSMRGEPIKAVSDGVNLLLYEMKGNPVAIETVWLSVIEYDTEAKQIVPLVPVYDFRMPELKASGNTALGKALKLLSDCIDREVRKNSPESKGDWKPLVFILSDGRPTGGWKRAADALNARKLARIVACGAGDKVNVDNLKRITQTVVLLKESNSAALGEFFVWISQSIETTSRSIGRLCDDDIDLPPPPDVVVLV